MLWDHKIRRDLQLRFAVSWLWRYEAECADVFPAAQSRGEQWRCRNLTAWEDKKRGTQLFHVLHKVKQKEGTLYFLLFMVLLRNSFLSLNYFCPVDINSLGSWLLTMRKQLLFIFIYFFFWISSEHISNCVLVSVVTWILPSFFLIVTVYNTKIADWSFESLIWGCELMLLLSLYSALILLWKRS